MGRGGSSGSGGGRSGRLHCRDYSHEVKCMHLDLLVRLRCSVVHVGVRALVKQRREHLTAIGMRAWHGGKLVLDHAVCLRIDAVPEQL